jgi:hypothetical protein
MNSINPETGGWAARTRCKTIRTAGGGTLVFEISRKLNVTFQTAT